MSRIRLLVLLSSLATVGLALGSAPAEVQACPSQQIEWTYYTDGTYSTPCGGKIIACSCGSGAYYYGCQTSYYTIDYYDC
jgi:hypothetical protein